MPDRTVTLPLVWREDGEWRFLEIGPLTVGWVHPVLGIDWQPCIAGNEALLAACPTRAAAMAALEEAVMALGVDRG